MTVFGIRSLNDQQNAVWCRAKNQDAGAGEVGCLFAVHLSYKHAQLNTQMNTERNTRTNKAKLVTKTKKNKT